MKKLRSLWAKWFHRPKQVTWITDPGTSLHVIEVEDKSDSLTEALGMSNERRDYLVKKTHSVFLMHNNIVAVMQEMSKECKHANELFFVATVIVHKQRDNQGPAGIIEMIMSGRRPGKD